MTTFARSSRTTDPGRQGPAPARSVAIRWVIARAAAAGARPDLVGGIGPPVVLEWLLEPTERGGVRGGVRLVDGESTTELLAVLECGPGSWLQGAHRLTHIDIPGLISVSLRATPEGNDLLYARIGLLGDWGIPGGRYQAAAGPIL